MAGLEKIIKVLKQAPKVVDEVPSLLTILGRAGVPAEAAKITKPLGKDAALEAVRKIAERSKKVDDWGWKGGKPGEITGIEYEKLPKTRKLEEKVGKQYLAASSKGKLPLLSGQEDVDRLMLDFATLERADIPRQWTGKVMRAHRGRLIDNAADELGIRPDDVRFLSADDRFSTEVNYASKLSDLMRPMTNDQRETFVALLPEWTGSLDELAEAAKNL